METFSNGVSFCWKILSFSFYVATVIQLILFMDSQSEKDPEKSQHGKCLVQYNKLVTAEATCVSEI